MTIDGEQAARTDTASTTGAVASKLLGPNSRRQFIDAAAPVVAFLAGNHLLGPLAAVVLAVAVAVTLSAWRLWRGDSVKIVGAALAAVTLHSVLVVATGEGRSYFLPELFGSLALAIVFGVTVPSRRPLTLRVCQRFRIHSLASVAVHKHRLLTILWTVQWLVHVVVIAPLYAADQVTALGIATIILGKPSVILAIAASWWWLRKHAASASHLIQD
ncbi:DUF3159 domain-containing protein [Nocardia cyriacigeorgica]|jgi:hypothetical protein|uniref:DUF3159 domain-containing protein n=1 Tax=Nocardia cyriacigeorgica TaxID=135487 RepID=UPI000565AA2D|nr:DUF3159 domain-containing protein [Nocardia cyriacigeorgica]AVH24077.1 DUF3159 domain-containing protein [Nocardia cyriacigeorgica]MBF6326177.1 DUF3159 domain-containing protein [Nocardia cyriacigeorgica]MBF6499145.1 DUF3159 domain-containing protein [Nocardia cyriacigeorgica]PPJ08933.1 DUF3159 domain-containing protein [Nocardia cyriacigeorgica]TLF59836.1 DUF3159 domain-containing protein [Nocardia cyriacigeorgica]